ncbi:phosphate ABC transporter permease subunit PstC [Plastoroseomonas hellenica]|uniref:Phosphate transport system permease protein n=1 Tax=Plastoroseomonas hellenica TaxID=2687306 RepID=A0ABS5EWX0_9PROT|nr:phosphate ABC transporter permease subunit PstC [Plastoroseomonas hellenica]MBR0642590.1 phosphate ABC transporter permease subunit PstC [Plastoroseomonas hellenica]MBR0664802.1 phosphate ABC transporter permease subunit PstC [Plastoroseomonas hellenica]
MSQAVIGADAPPAPTGRKTAGRLGDSIFEWLCRGAGILVLLILGAIILTLFIGGLPAFQAFGFQFLWSTAWNPVEGRENYGAFISIFGTVVSSVLAIIFAVPVAFGIAFFLTELAPEWLKRPIGTAIELLAAVPSIIFGMWGLFVLVPFVQQHIQLSFGETLGELPLIGFLFASNSFTGTSLFAAALVLAIMILPFIAATMRDVFSQVPPVFKESAYGLGATRWEVVRNVVLPYTRISVVGGIMLGLGRALGETMAVTFVIGNANRLATSLFDPSTTIASVVAMEFPESLMGSLKQSSLLALGFLLFVISFLVLAASRYLLRSRLKA